MNNKKDLLDKSAAMTIMNVAYARIKELEDDCKFLLAFAPFGHTPENLSPMFYKTGTYEGDVELCERIKKIQLSMHPVKRESDGTI